MTDENKEVSIDEVSIDDANVAPENAPVDADTPADATPDMAAELAEMTDKYMRAIAELENTRRRAALDAESAARTRAMSVAGKFLPVMDAIAAAQKHAPDDQGIAAMARAMESAFAQIGITKIDSVGQVLNPMLHNAIQVVDAPASDAPVAPNTIIEEFQPGYMFGDAVLRTAMVVVAK